jgi:tRNA A-37 threonylcarbamoyl transferase component Bud32
MSADLPDRSRSDLETPTWLRDLLGRFEGSWRSGTAADPPTWLLDLLERFEAAWKQSPPPVIDHFLPTTEAERRMALLPLLACDLECRLRAGQSIRVEDYQARYPELVQQTALCELIAVEYELRRQRTSVSLADYLHRFPQLEMELRALFGSPEETDDQTTGALPATPSPSGAPGTAGCRLPPLRYKPGPLHDKGNLGEVLRAQDEELHREVALKRIQARHADNPDSRRRFLREAEVTGRLEHPGVVPVYGLGEDVDGRPCYAMRFIQGESLKEAIERFHAAEKPGRDAGERRLALRQLLTSFVTVCKTVAFAHSRGILHRDLKPANIMLGKYGETLVVDWGLAKTFERDDTAESLTEESLQPTLVGGETQVGQVVGTPAYCGPEQASAELDKVGPASDIFSLGAVLYNLLTNRVPYAGSGVVEILAQAGAGLVVPPRQRKKDVPRPLEAICLKAMARQPLDRYDTALDLAADVEHWLGDEPVQAYREPLAARAGRWLRQHRALAAGLAAAVAVALVSLTLVLIVVAGKNGELRLANQREAARAEAERLAKDEAEKRLSQIEKGTDILGSIFADLDPHAEEKEGKPLREILGKRVEAAAAQLQGESIADALTVAKLQSILGRSLLGLGQFLAAGVVLETASATQAAELGEDDPATLQSRNNLARAYQRAGKVDLAIPLFERILKVRETTLGDDHPDTLTSRNNLAAAYQDAGRVDLAIPLLQSTLKAFESKLGHDHSNTLAARNNLAGVYQDAGQVDLALPLLETILKVFESKLGEDHLRTLAARNNLAMAYQDAGQLDLALALLRRTAQALEAKLGDDHPHTLASRNNLALAYKAAGQVDLAIPLFQRTFKALEAKLGVGHPDTLASCGNLALAYVDAAQPELAVPLLQRTLKAQEVKLGADHPDTLSSRNNLALAFREAGQLNLALPLFEMVISQAQKKLGPAHPSTLAMTTNWIAALRADGQCTRAVQAGKELLVIQRQAFGKEDPRLAAALTQLGSSLLAAKQPVEAESLLRESLAIRTKKEPDAWTTFNTETVLGAALLSQKKYADAESMLLGGYEGMNQRQAKIPPKEKLRLNEALQRLVQLHEATGKKDEAAKWRKKLDAAKEASSKKKPD